MLSIMIFFKSINSEEQAYLLGFYVADGNINEKRKTFRIKISKEDQEIIEMYKKEISPNARIIEVNPYVIKGRNEKEYISNPQAIIDINSAIIVKSLVSLGYGYNKTYSNLNLPNLSEDLLIHFIRGYFDGDGSIIIWKNVEKGKKDRVRCKFEICCKNNSLLNDIVKFFKTKNISINLNYLKRDDMYRISTSSKSEIKKINELLYKNANLFLTRKKNKLNNYVNSEIVQKTTDDCNA